MPLPGSHVPFSLFPAVQRKGGSWPGRANEGFKLVARNLPFAGLPTQELGVLFVGPLMAGSGRLSRRA